MGNTKAIMFTISTYGTWLRGDARGWVDDGIVFPAQPALQAWDRDRMKHSPYLFPRDRWLEIGGAMGESLLKRFDARIRAWTLQGWHSHGVIGSTRHDIADIIKCVKDAARWHLRIIRPIWAADYDKRWCFEWPSVGNRVGYVEKHNVRNGCNPKPWPFISTPEELL
ncbi:MAG TPA: hypothetical protein VLI90_13340 [Tepidisphaeraceae bacterium]|nr:hypothetical protein [Tepidisphaeraceae bacterium]